MMLINFSLPPDERYKLENLLFLGHIPGPDQPKDVDSFLEPLIAEFEVLQHGITAYNALQDEEFLLRAHIIAVGADSRGREKVLHNTGTGSYRYYPYCTAYGIQTDTVYCPFTKPTNEPPPGKSVHEAFENIHFQTPPIRNDTDWRNIAEHLEQYPQDKNFVFSTGIKGRSIFHRLSSIIFPLSFPIDAMHVFYEGVILQIFNHQRG